VNGFSAPFRSPTITSWSKAWAITEIKEFCSPNFFTLRLSRRNQVSAGTIAAYDFCVNADILHEVFCEANALIEINIGLVISPTTAEDVSDFDVCTFSMCHDILPSGFMGLMPVYSIIIPNWL
jgi:hypothetical protein